MKYFTLVIILLIPFTNTFAQWTDGQNASIAIGASTFTSGVWSCTATTTNGPGSIAIDETNNKLYLADIENNRVLRYALPIASNQPTAERVFGQANFTTGTANRGGAAANNTMNKPRAVVVDANGRLWVADCDNNRILRFDAAHSQATDGGAADGVLGQPDFTTTTTGTTASTLNLANYLSGLTISSSGTLFITDYGNNRVLKYNTAASKANGAAADGVLGQANFTSNSAGTSSTTLSGPIGICLKNTTMYIGDSGNNRVLRFDNPESAANGAAANGVLGRPNFTSATGGTTQSTMNGPAGVALDGSSRLYVTDKNNVRILIFNNAASKSNGATADNVLGQANFTSSTQAISQAGFWYPYSSTVDVTNARLYIADYGGGRALRYNASTALPVQFSSFKVAYHNQTNLLVWTTSSEHNADFFAVEKSIDGIHWSKIAEVKASGNSNNLQKYSYTDNTTNTELTFYRLKQVDFNLSFSYSNIIEVNHAREEILLNVFPNPTQGKFTIRLEKNDNDVNGFKIIDIQGNEVFSDNDFQHEIDLSNLPKGTYFIQVYINKELLVRKLVLSDR